MDGDFEVVSIREFARRAGLSDTAIKKYYLDTLKIPLDARTVSAGGQPRLFYEPAKDAFLAYSPGTIFNETNKVVLVQPEPERKPDPKPERIKKIKQPKVLTPKPETKQSSGAVSLSERIMYSKRKLPKPLPDEPTEEKTEPDIKKQKVKEIPVKEPTEIDVGRLEILESERRTKAAEAKLKEMKYAEAMGKLVDKDKQAKALFQMGIQLRDKLLAIPARVIDNIRAADDRNEAEMILTNEMHKALSGLSELK